MAANKVITGAGARGTGKTDYLKNNIIPYTPLPKVLLVDTFDNPVWRNMATWDKPENAKYEIPIITLEKLPYWEKGVYRIFSSNPSEIFKAIEEHVMNCLIIIDDGSKHIGKNLTWDQKRFIYDSKQKNLNLIFFFHSLVAIPGDLVRASDYLILFKTNEGKPSLSKYPFPEIPIMMKKLRESKDHYANVTIRLN